LLGGFELRCWDETLALATRKAEALIALLALRPGQSFARDGQ
jgi:DNA-binding SARP family transcriptional activator